MLLALVAGFALGSTVQDVANLVRVPNWPVVQGVVEAHAYEAYKDEETKTTDYAMEVRYLYEWDGALFRGFRPELRPQNYRNRADVLKSAARAYPIGAKVPVHVDPQGRSGSYLSMGEPPALVPYFFAGGLLALIGAAALRQKYRTPIGWLFFYLGVGGAFGYFDFNSTSPMLEADEPVEAQMDTRPILQRMALVVAPDRPKWKKLQTGMTLEEALQWTGPPVAVELKTPDRLKLSYTDKSFVLAKEGDGPFLVEKAP